MRGGEGIDLATVSDVQQRASECPAPDPNADAREAVAKSEAWIQQQTVGAVVQQFLGVLRRDREVWDGTSHSVSFMLRTATRLALEEGSMREVWQQGSVELWNWVVSTLQSHGVSVSQEVSDIQNAIAVTATRLKCGDRIVVDYDVMQVRDVKERYATVDVWCDRVGVGVFKSFNLRQEVRLVTSDSRPTQHQQAKDCPDARSVQEET